MAIQAVFLFAGLSYIPGRPVAPVSSSSAFVGGWRRGVPVALFRCFFDRRDCSECYSFGTLKEGRGEDTVGTFIEKAIQHSDSPNDPIGQKT